MASISKQFREKLKRILSKKPLQEGEFRKIQCLGDYHISLSPEHNGEEYLFSMEIEGATVYLFR